MSIDTVEPVSLPELDPSRVPIGVDGPGSWVDLRFTDIENPHILIVGGSQVGKTTLQILIAAVAASRGNIVVVLDPKRRFSKAFRHPKTKEPLPNVLVYRDSDEAVASREWQGILELIIAEKHLRYGEDEQADTDILEDQQRFPTVLVVVDELGNLLDFTDEEWLDRKPDGYKGNTPVRKMLHVLVRAGAEARIVGCFANQTASEKELPAGTRTRQLCGQRIFIGPITEGTHWRMLAGEGVKPPNIPAKKGAGAIMYGDSKIPTRFQAAFVDWKKRPESIYALASLGVPILQRSGYLDEHGRLRLGGVPVPRPGQMASHVAGPHIDLLHREQVESLVPEVDEWADVQTHTDIAEPAPDVVVPEPVMIVGNQAAADVCGLTVANFRRLRELNPIPNQVDKYEGNKPAWGESDLREWKLRYADRRDNGKPKRGAA